jgi:catechol 2,3-dioxygenase-like lactoylglutathione lyase family enzyme
MAVFGAHVIVFSNDAAADRAFLRDVLGFASVDAGHDWLIFALPPAELAVHPAEPTAGGGPGDGAPGAELYLMCEDLAAQVAELESKGVRCAEVEEARWGSITRFPLPGGGSVGLYQPRHPLAIDRAR